MSRTSQEIISLQKLYCFFKLLFLLRILLRTSDTFFLIFLADLNISFGRSLLIPCSSSDAHALIQR